MSFCQKNIANRLLPKRPVSLAMCLWTRRKGEDAGFGKIMRGKIMRIFMIFARHDFATVFIRNRE
jgi:hypothetical protein